MEIIEAARHTTFTKTVHNAPYDALDPSRPELSQAGQTVLITGGGTAIGNGIGQSFVRASAKTVIIVGRRPEVLEKGAARLREVAREAGTPTTIIHRKLDITDFPAVDAFWKQLADEGVVVDVFVSNAVAFPEVKPLLQAGAESMWSNLNANLNAPMYLLTKFNAQGTGKKKFVINVSSNVTHIFMDPLTKDHAAYSFNKTCGTLLFQMVAKDVPVEEMQIVSFHPGLIWQEQWVKMGFTDPAPFDDIALQGNFAVWLASPNAAFLHGRFVWATWDVNELSSGEIRKRIDEDPYHLMVKVNGL